jgi:hypothetical protein
MRGLKRRAKLVIPAILLVILGSTGPAISAAKAAAGYTPPSCAMAVPTAGAPSVCSWQGIRLQSPGAGGTVAGPDLATACHPTTLAECEDTHVVVPPGLKSSSLYLKVSWQHPVWSAFMYVIDPKGVLHGTGGIGCDTSTVEKGCGNQTTLPYDELVLADPMPGTWTVRVAAVNIHDESYLGQAALTASAPIAYAKKSLAQMTSYLTRGIPVNIVFAGWHPSSSDLSQLSSNLTTELEPSVAEKTSCDGGDAADLPGSGLIQNETCHFTATDSGSSANSAGAVPYFEPLRYLMQPRYLVADDNWTKGLFGAIKGATTFGHTLSSNGVPETTQSAPLKAAYLQAYNAQYGANRGASHLVTDSTKVDEINGMPVEDWVFNSRLSPKYAQSFLDLSTGKTTSGSFIDPDPTAAHDPYWNQNGKLSKPNVDRDPQGVNNGVTFFLLDTFDASYADNFFTPNRYHYWWTADQVKDPDTGESAFIDNGRGWGGRYRFYMLDLGAAPSSYERADWVSASVAADGGSAAFDPPIWDYHHSPMWNGSQPVGPLQAGGNTIGQVMGWEITQGMAFKFVGGYLYRPLPNDVYVFAVDDVVDHYSLPSEGDLYTVDMSKVANNAAALHSLSASMPYVSFLPGPSVNKTLGCAANRAEIVGNPTILGALTSGMVKQVPDPTCSAATSDPFQQAVEDGKANGGAILTTYGGASVYDYAVDQDYIRDYIDHNRPKYAPLYPGAFTVPVVNIMFEKDYNVDLPLLVGGVASSVNNGEGWGQFDNVNDILVPANAVVCSKSAPTAPGCNGIPDTFRHNYGLTYVMEHESSHFLGLNHPHDGANTVGKAADGSWHYYYSMLKWTYDSSASPTTYAGDYGTYEVPDQEKLMAGHAAEYLRQANDSLYNDYFQDGAKGLTGPSAATLADAKRTNADINQASALFKVGDYLHAMYAMRNAALHAQGIVESPVAPHQMTLQQAAHNSQAIFTINPQKAYFTPPTVKAAPVWFAPADGPAHAASVTQPAVLTWAELNGDGVAD